MASVPIRIFSKIFLLSAGLASSMACSTTRHNPPSFVQAPTFEYSILKDRTIKIVVLDHRADRKESERLISSVHQSVSRSFDHAGVRVANTTDAQLEIRVMVYRADFELGNWNGCARLFATLDLAPENRIEIPVEKCVKKSNLWGYASGDEAAQSAYSDALVELLSRIDRTR